MVFIKTLHKQMCSLTDMYWWLSAMIPSNGTNNSSSKQTCSNSGKTHVVQQPLNWLGNNVTHLLLTLQVVMYFNLSYWSFLTSDYNAQFPGCIFHNKWDKMILKYFFLRIKLKKPKPRSQRHIWEKNYCRTLFVARNNDVVTASHLR